MLSKRFDSLGMLKSNVFEKKLKTNTIFIIIVITFMFFNIIRMNKLFHVDAKSWI